MLLRSPFSQFGGHSVMTPALHIPLDFERLESIRLLGRRLGSISAHHGALAPLYAIRVWMDWGLKGQQHRPLQNKPIGAAIDHDWQSENITFVLEDAARWQGEAAALMRAMIDTGFIRVVVVPQPQESSMVALVLTDFWRWNEHLDPAYKSIQRRGADATNLKRALEKFTDAARDRRQIFDSQGFLPFGSAQPSVEEQEACYALFMRLHRECGLDLPNSQDFTESAMSDALRVVRQFTPAELGTVEQYVIEHAGDVDFVKIPARILENFRELLGKAQRQ
jgi:hypothetical protein